MTADQIPPQARAAVARILGHPDVPFKAEDRLTRQQAADYLRISTSRLAQLRRAGEIQQQRNARTGQVRFRFQDVVVLKVLRGEFAAQQDVAR